MTDELPPTFTHDGVTFSLRRGRTIEYVLDGWVLRSGTAVGRYHEAEQLRVNNPREWAELKNKQIAQFESVIAKLEAMAGPLREKPERIETTVFPPKHLGATKSKRLESVEAVEAPAATVAVDAARQAERQDGGPILASFCATCGYELTPRTYVCTKCTPRPPRPMVLDLHPDIDPELRERIMVAVGGVLRCAVYYGGQDLAHIPRVRHLRQCDLFSPRFIGAVGAIHMAYYRWSELGSYNFFVDHPELVKHGLIEDEANRLGATVTQVCLTTEKHGWRVTVELSRKSKIWRGS